MSRPYGDFVGEQDCRCGFMLDRYETDWDATFADPDTGERVENCPDCDCDLWVLGRTPYKLKPLRPRGASA